MIRANSAKSMDVEYPNELTEGITSPFRSTEVWKYIIYHPFKASEGLIVKSNGTFTLSINGMHRQDPEWHWRKTEEELIITG